MNTLLDMVGSFLVGGLLLLTVLAVRTNTSDMALLDQLELIVQENIAELTSEMDYDFRKIGCGVQNPALAIIRADTSSISFWSDIDNDGDLDSIRYWLGATGEVMGTVNPRDRILHRRVNNQTNTGSLGVVDFRIRLFDISGASTNNTTLAKRIDYYLLIENPFPIDTVYARSAWNGTIRPKNL